MSTPIQSVVSFYDAVAEEYNTHMTDQDVAARAKVRELFNHHVKGTTVLDFGGGTGLDLPWIQEHNRSVVFVEPSNKMRVVAKTAVNNPKITFVDDQVDFTKWSADKVPFSKVDGILANFAVLNCIEHVDVLFKKLHSVTNPGCTLIATIVNPVFVNLWRYYSLSVAVKMKFLPRLTVLNKYQQTFHPTFIYSVDYLRQVSKGYFLLTSIQPLNSSRSLVLIFRRDDKTT